MYNFLRSTESTPGAKNKKLAAILNGYSIPSLQKREIILLIFIPNQRKLNCLDFVFAELAIYSPRKNC